MQLFKFILPVFFLAVSSLLAVGQSNPAAAVSQPAVIPPPPDAAALGRYGDVPVSMGNGQANISVPLYEIKTPRLTLPITLDYSSSGIKVDDLASWVGLEWSLNAGGVITRSVRGLDDFSTYGYYGATVPLAANVTAQNSWRFFSQTVKGLQDADPDYFFYNYAGNSGKFVFDENKQPMMIGNMQPINIRYAGGNTFTILDGKGNIYYFDHMESVTSTPTGSPTDDKTYVGSWYLSKIISNDRTDTISFTYVTDIQFAQCSCNYTQTVGSTYTTWYDNVIPACESTLNTDYTEGGGNIKSEPTTNCAPERLKEIDFKNGKIVFYSSNTRLDNPGVRMDSMIVSSYDFPSKSYLPIKKIKAGYGNYITELPNMPSLTTTSYYHLRLDSLSIIGGDNSPGGKYKFLYDSTMIAYYGGTGRDLFGYYNGKNSNVGLIQSQSYFYSGFTYTVGGADRSTNPDSIQAGILKWMYYPTGGYSHFTYEPNTYQGSFQDITEVSSAMGSSHQVDSVSFTPVPTVVATVNIIFSSYNYSDVHTRPYVVIKNLTTGQSNTYNGLDPNGSITSPLYYLSAGQNYRLYCYAFDDSKVTVKATIEWQQYDGTTVSGAGLRIKQITNYDVNNRFISSDLYKYGAGESGFGFLPSNYTLLNTNNSPRTFQYGCSGFVYPCGIGVASATREVFSANSLYDIFSLAGSPIGYSQVAKYMIDSLGNSLGKSVYDFSVYQNGVVPGSSGYGEAICITNTGWDGGKMTAQRDYAWKSGVFWPVKATYYSYTDIHRRQGRGLKIGQIYVPMNGTLALDSASVAPCFNSIYYWFDYPIYGGSIVSNTQTIVDYDITDSTKTITKTTQMSYDTAANNLQADTIRESQSDGSLNITYKYYPEEISALSGLSGAETAAIDTLMVQHNLTALLQTTRYNGPSFVSRTKNHYGLWNNHMALPSSIEVQNGSAASETRLQFLQYDAYGNVQIVGKAGDAKKYYIWDYGNSLPVAEITNDPVGYSSYTGFEADGSGGFTLPDTTRVRTDAVTGNMSYNIAGKTITQSLYVSHTYVVSYWAKPGPLTVKWKVVGFGSYTAVAATAGLSKNGWTYYEHILPTTAATVQITSTTGLVDDLRIYPVGSLMKSYTYQPLAGITSVSTENSLFTTYEYDGLARLKTIRDMDKNAVKVYDYEYQVSPHTFYNTSVSLGYTRNNCTSCQIGGPVTYTVPAGMFSSLISQTDANNQALAYNQANGQAYANANGSCSAPVAGTTVASNSSSNTFIVVFTNNCTSTQYHFNLSFTTGTNWTTIPQGTYTVQITGGNSSDNYNINGYYQSGASANFTNIPINSVSNYLQVH